MNETRNKIIELVAIAEAAIPSELLPDLPPSQQIKEVPEWHAFEHQIWKRGEDIRQLLAEKKSLRKDPELQRTFLRIACNEKAKRGRQSFIMLLGYAVCAQFAPDISRQLSDPHVAGHAIDTLSKMHCADYVEAIKPYASDKTAWIRNKAKQYVEKYG
jgi:hypothetical protein